MIYSLLGLFAAAAHTGNDAALEAPWTTWNESRRPYGMNASIRSIPLDPKLRPEPRDGFRAHGAYMIQIGTLAMLAEAGIGGAIERGLRLVDAS